MFVWVCSLKIVIGCICSHEIIFFKPIISNGIVLEWVAFKEQ